MVLGTQKQTGGGKEGLPVWQGSGDKGEGLGVPIGLTLQNYVSVKSPSSPPSSSTTTVTEQLQEEVLCRVQET